MSNNIKIIIDMLKKGTGAKDAASDLKLTGFEAAIAADKLGQFNKRQKELAAAVNSGAREYDDAEKELREYRHELGLIDNEATQATGKVDQFANVLKTGAMVLGGVAIAAKGAQVAIQLFNQGAQLDKTRSEFDALAGSIGTVSDALLNDLKAATDGMMADSEIIASANQLISFGLAKTHDEVVRLASVAGKLNLNMEVLGLTLANDSKMRLDALGLSVEDINNRMKELKDANYLGDAFDQAVISALEARAELVDTSDSAAAAAQRLEKAWQNVKEAVAQDWAGLVAPLVIEAAGEIGVSDLENQIKEKFGLNAIEFANLSSEFNVGGFQTAAEDIAGLNAMLDALTLAQDRATATTIAGYQAQYDFAEAFARTESAVRSEAGATAIASRQHAVLTDELIDAAIATGLLTDGIYRSDGGMMAIKDSLIAAGYNVELFTQNVLDSATGLIAWQTAMYETVSAAGAGLDMLYATQNGYQAINDVVDDAPRIFSGAAAAVRGLGDAFASSAQSGITSTLKSLFDDFGDKSPEEMAQALIDSVTDAKVDVALDDLGQKVAQGLISPEEAVAQMAKLKDAIASGEGIFNTSVGVQEAKVFFDSFSGDLNAAILDYEPPLIEIPYSYTMEGEAPAGLPNSLPGQNESGGNSNPGGAQQGSAQSNSQQVTVVTVRQDQWDSAMIQFGGV